MIFERILMLTAWVSLSMLPAIVIYKRFPDTAVAVSGPLSKFTINATGAFAAFLVVFLIFFPIVQPMFNGLGNVSHLSWTINGKLKLINKDGNAVHSKYYLDNLKIITHPEMQWFADPTFSITISEYEKGVLRNVVFDIPGFGSSTWERQPDEHIDSDSNNTIVLNTPIVIKQTIPVNVSDNVGPEMVPAR